MSTVTDGAAMKSEQLQSCEYEDGILGIQTLKRKVAVNFIASPRLLTATFQITENSPLPTIFLFAFWFWCH